MQARIIVVATALSLGVPAAAAAGPSGREQGREPVVVEVSDGGFRWADAAIGAGAASGAWLVLLGAVAMRRIEKGDT